jgi:CPA2 family monovalent cation:H+ antiporter-2
MPHEVALIATIAVGLAIAFLLGFLAVRLKLPPLIGYMLAGIVVGPFTPGFVADPHLTPQLAEIGVILLMFGVGMHFSIRDLLAVRHIAVPGAIVQIIVATALGGGVAALWGWPLGASLVFGLSLSVASTVVLLRALEARGQVDSGAGRIAVGWLIVEDLAMVLALVLLPAFAGLLGAPNAAQGPAGLAGTVGLTLVKVAAFVTVMLVVGSRLFPWVLQGVERTGSPELFTLAVIALSLGVAFASYVLFGVSLALGAFFAGMVVHESDLNERAATELRPLQDIFAAFFFVSVGMLLDPAVFVREPLHVLEVLAIIVLGKSLAALGIVLALGHPLNTAGTVSAALAQIGEFSFILIGLGIHLGLIPEEAQSLVVAGAILSIAVNPVAFLAAARWLPAESSRK